MKKIILNERTASNIISRLKNFMEGKVFKTQSFYNLPPNKVRRYSKYDKSGLGERFSMLEYFFDSKVTKHPFANERLYINGSNKPLIHVSMHKDCTSCYYEGDVFYFFGSMILVDEKHSPLLKSRGMSGKKDRVVEKLQLIDAPDKELLGQIKSRYDFEERMAKSYYETVELEWDEQEKEIEETKI